MRAELKRLIWEWRGVWIATPSIAAAVIGLRLLGLLQPMEWLMLDRYVRWRPVEAVDHRIAIVGIDEADVQQIGQAIVPDGIYAQLLKKLKAMQPRAIGLDIYRDLPVEPGHAELVEVFASTENLVGVRKVIGDSRREAVSAPPQLQAKGQVGANDLVNDEDSRVRRALLAVKDKNGNTVYSFSAYLALLYLYAEGITPKTVEGTDNWWQLGGTVFVPFEGNDGGYVRADAGGYQVLLNYRGPTRHFNTVSMMDILEDRVPPEWGRDRIILIGAVGESFQDLYSTPYTRSPSERMAGVEVHANIASLIISAALDDRPLLQSWSDFWEGAWIFLWSGAGATLTWKGRYTGRVSKLLLQRTASPVLAGGMLLGSTYAAFLLGWWIPVVPPGLALAGSAIAITAYIARTAGDIRQIFGRYLTDEVVASLLEHPEGLKLGGERRMLTILTSDLRGFTAISERLPPEEVVKILNYYLGYMAKVIARYQGTIDEFMGDGILVLFGAPTAREDDAKRAVACAVAMQLAMDPVNEKMKEWGLPQLEMGIGINTGEVVVGNIGSEERTKYGVVGANVNLTYRIESYTIGGEILISDYTLKQVGSIVRIDRQKRVQPKGVKQPITIYDVGGIGGSYNLFLPKFRDEVFLPLTESLPIHYTVLEGKHIDNNLVRGRLVKLSAKGAEICANGGGVRAIPPPLSNIKLNFVAANNLGDTDDDVYAKVLEKPADRDRFYIYFTAKPPEVAAMLDALYKSIRR